MEVFLWIIAIILLYKYLGEDGATFVLICALIYYLVNDDEDTEPTPEPELPAHILQIERWDCPGGGECVVGDNDEVILTVKVHPNGEIPEMGGYVQLVGPDEDPTE